MNPTPEIGNLLINTLGSLVVLIFVLRFLLQLVRADFYNPISQFIVKASNPILVPLRRIIPGYGGLDLSSILLACAAQILVMVLSALIAETLSFSWLQILVIAPFKLMLLVLNIYFWGLVIVVIASWITPTSYNPALILINQILEPVMRPVRRMMPNLGGLDLSPIILFLAIQVAEILVKSAAYNVQQLIIS